LQNKKTPENKRVNDFTRFEMCDEHLSFAPVGKATLI